MDIKRINKLIKELPSNQQEAILGIIEEKTNEDMKEVINVIKHLETKMDSKFEAMDSKFNAKFDAIDSKFSAIENTMDAKFSAIDSKFSAIDSKFTTVFWILGVLTTVLVGILLKVLS